MTVSSYLLSKRFHIHLSFLSLSSTLEALNNPLRISIFYSHKCLFKSLEITPQFLKFLISAHWIFFFFLGCRSVTNVGDHHSDANFVCSNAEQLCRCFLLNQLLRFLRNDVRRFPGSLRQKIFSCKIVCRRLFFRFARYDLGILVCVL